MSLRRIFPLIGGLSAVLLLLMLLEAYYSLTQFESLDRRSRTLVEMLQHTNELSALAGELQIHRRDRLLSQWRDRSTALRRNLDGVTSLDPGDAPVLLRMRRALESADQAFESLFHLSLADERLDEADRRRRTVLLLQFRSAAHQLSSLNGQLGQRTQAAQDRVLRLSRIAFAATFLVAVGLAVVIFLLFRRSVLLPVARLDETVGQLPDLEEPAEDRKRQSANEILAAISELTRRSERLLASQQALGEQAGLLTTVFESMQVGLTVYDGEQRMQAHNTRFREIYGFPEALVANGAHYLDQLAFLQERGLLAAENEPRDINPPSADPGGAIRHQIVERGLSDGRILSVERIPLDSGGWLGVVADVTAIRRAERALQQSEERFRDFAELGSDWFWETDSNRKISYSSPEFLDRHGLSMTDVIGKTRYEIGLLAEEEEEVDILQQLQERKRLNNVLVLRRPGREPVYLQSAARPLLDGNGNWLGYRCVSSDITVEYTFRKALNASNEELERFAYVASHDLQEPLRVISGFCDLLRRDYADRLDERGLEFLAFVVDGAGRMRSLIDDLLLLSRVGRGELELEPVDPARLLDQIENDLSLAIADAGATLRRGALEPVLAEPRLLAQVLQNLVANAIKFRGDDAPQVDIATECHPEGILLYVKDNGIGIPEEHAERVFEAFKRLHGRSEFAGNGIGLAICRRAMERMGGRIWIDTDNRDGTRFCLLLRRAEQT